MLPQTDPSESQRTPDDLGDGVNTQLFMGKIAKQISRKLNSGCESESIFDFVFDSLDIVIPYDRMGIAISDDGEAAVRLVWVKSKVPIQHLKVGYSANLKGSSLQSILQTGRPRIINDLAQYASDHPQSKSTELVLRDGIRSSLTCPLRANDKFVGFVFFSSRKMNTYDEEHIQIFLDIAEELSVIVEQGRLKNFFELNKSKAQTLGMVLHDLRSPLGIIQGFIEMSRNENWFANLNDEAKDIFSVLHRNTQFMFGLLNELAAINQLDRQDSNPDKQHVNLSEFLTNIIKNGKLLTEKKNIEFAMHIDPTLPTKMIFDPDKIRQVMDNLLSNAVKYSDRHSRICFSAQYESNRIVFAVEDHGRGIPPDELPKLFREFGKTSTRPTEGEHSTGLGLAIAKRIVEQHGGKISVQSVHGVGSTFRFWIPSS